MRDWSCLRDLARLLGARYAPGRASLDTFEVCHEAQRAALAQLRALDLKRHALEGRGLVLYGSIGTGKDHLLAALLYEATRLGVSCSWLAGGAACDKDRTAERVFGGVDTAQVLGLSDPVLPAAPRAAWELARLQDLVDQRYRAGRATWVTINARSPEEARDLLTAPIWDRLREGAELVRCLWPSYRERAAPAAARHEGKEIGV